MPITWTPENVSRLFLVTLAVHHITMDYKRIASAFGEEASPRAIEEKMKKLRKEARDISGIPGLGNKRQRKDVPGSFNSTKSKGGIGKNPRGRPKGSTTAKGKEFGMGSGSSSRMYDGDDSETEERKLFGDLMEAHIIKKEKEEREQRERIVYGVVDPRIIKQESEMQAAANRVTSFFQPFQQQPRESFEGWVQPKVEEAVVEEDSGIDTHENLLQPKVEPGIESGITIQQHEQPEVESSSSADIIQPKVEPPTENEVQPKIEEVELFSNTADTVLENEGGEVQILLEQSEMEKFVDLSSVPLADDLEKLVESVVLTDAKQNNNDDDDEVTEVDSTGIAIKKPMDKASASPESDQTISESGQEKENINIKKENRSTPTREDSLASNLSDNNETPMITNEAIEPVPFGPVPFNPFVKDHSAAPRVSIKIEDSNAEHDDVIIIS